MTWLHWIRSDRHFWSLVTVSTLISIGLGFWLSPPIFKGDRIYTPKEELPTKPLASLTNQETIYKVYVGNLTSRELILQLSEELKKNNFPHTLVEENGLYRLQMGAFKELENAKELKKQLDELGYAPELMIEKRPLPEEQESLKGKL